MAPMIGPYFSLKKASRTFRLIHKQYKRKAKSLDAYTKESVEAHLKALYDAISKKEDKKAVQMAKELKAASLRFMPKTTFEKFRDSVTGLVFALLVAVFIRTMWFELYTIPSGSMRPTLKEEDYLVVSKTDYGINIPLQVKHFYFDPDLIHRGSIIVFNGANMDIEDVETIYFYLFKGKKQFVKRLIGKPGDIIYFYGGKIYGLDKDGKEIEEFKNADWAQNLEHIPMIRFQGRVETTNGVKNGLFSSAIFHQLNQPIAKMSLGPNGKLTGSMLLKDKENYADFLGMKHFATARILTKDELQKVHPGVSVGSGILYLELTHHPSLKTGELIRDEYNRMRPGFGLSTSILPLQKRHVDKLAEAMTTCRFVVKDSIAYRLGINPKGLAHYLPKFEGLKDGIYEIQNGKAYSLPFPQIPILGIFTNGMTKELSSDHLLYSKDPKMVQKLFNLGIEFLNHYWPKTKQQSAIPSRYAYFRDEALYLMGSKIFEKDDPILKTFIQDEKQKASPTYEPFIDNHAPTIEEIRKNGVKIPERMYLALGDNHAMSADSRDFGFVPEDNLKGGVSFLFSPLSNRLGNAPQPTKKHLTFPNVAVISAFLFAVFATSTYYKRKMKKPLKF